MKAIQQQIENLDFETLVHIVRNQATKEELVQLISNWDEERLEEVQVNLDE